MTKKDTRAKTSTIKTRDSITDGDDAGSEFTGREGGFTSAIHVGYICSDPNGTAGVFCEAKHKSETSVRHGCEGEKRIVEKRMYPLPRRGNGN